MSIDEIPLVEAYRSTVLDALENSQNILIARFEEVRRQNFETVEDGPVHNSALEAAIREIFVQQVVTLDISDPEFEQVWRLVDIVNALSDNELCEPGLGFYFVEELLDGQTIEGCGKVFDYLESRREQMVKKNFKSKSLVILRCCNELLRRLSRAEDTVFCGRVFIYLFQVFPLGDKSSVNLRGEFHTENVTTYDEAPEKSEDAIKPMEMDLDGPRASASGAATPMSTQPDPETRTSRSTPSTRGKPELKTEAPPDLDTLYPIFWSLQGLSSSPTRLFETASLQQFKDGLSATLACFRHVAKATAPSTEPSDLRRSLKRKRAYDGAGSFNPKYLTNRDLFDLEIHDLAFRRHVLVQSLILIDFLLSLSPASKAKTANLTNKSVLYPYTLSEEDTKWAQTTRASIASYLQQSGVGSEGSLYYRMVDTVLSRDKNWARWKAENCPPISRSPLDPKVYLEAQESLQKSARFSPVINPPGADDLAFLQKNEPVEALKFPLERRRIPSLEDYHKAIKYDDLDIEMAMDDAERREIEERKAGKLWRALRSATGRRFTLCEQIKDGHNLAALVAEPDMKATGELNGTIGEDQVGDEGADESVAGQEGDGEDPEHHQEDEDEDTHMKEAPSTSAALTAGDDKTGVEIDGWAAVPGGKSSNDVVETVSTEPEPEPEPEPDSTTVEGV